MSNRRKLRQANGGRLTRPRANWTGKRRDTGSTYAGSGSNQDIRRGIMRRLTKGDGSNDARDAG